MLLWRECVVLCMFYGDKVAQRVLLKGCFSYLLFSHVNVNFV